jgi:hypothetical protein
MSSSILLVAFEANLLPVVCAQEEAVEVAEAVIDDAGDLAGVPVPFVAWLTLAGLGPGYQSLGDGPIAPG